MRVIAGQAKGVRLESPQGLCIRPTLDRVREALFSILAPRLDGARFLDLFAGTGANGIEALSRGAAWCTFVDSAGQALACIARNLDRTGFADRAERVRVSLPKGIDALTRRQAAYGVIFADPPYGFEQYGALLEAIQCGRILAGGGLVVIEHATGRSIPGIPGGLGRTREATYGDATLSFFA